MNLSWIHLENLKFFLFLGATVAEQMIGQNITINLSLRIPYTNTEDKLENTVDYEQVYQCVSEKILCLKRVHLLEYLAEQLLIEVYKKFPNIHSAKIAIEKDYVPIKNFTGKVTIVAEKQFIF